MDNSNFSIEDQNILDSIIPRKQGIKILEVGSWTGASTCVLGKIAKECGGFVIAVDHWKGTPNTWMQCKATHNDIFAEFQKNIKEVGLEKHIFPIVLDSKDAYQLFLPNTFDLIFIDGDHEYWAVKNDIFHWFSKLKEDGIICGHDCGNTWPGVKKSLDDLFLDTYEVIPNSTIWLKKY